jgi:hypothetical protein
MLPTSADAEMCATVFLLCSTNVVRNKLKPPSEMCKKHSGDSACVFESVLMSSFSRVVT